MSFEYTGTMADLFTELLKCNHENISLPVEWISGYNIEGKPMIKYFEETCYDCKRVVRRRHYPSFRIMFSLLEEDRWL